MGNFENFQSSYFSEHFSTTTFEKTEIQLEKYTNRKALKFVPTCPLFSRAYVPTSLRAYVYIYFFRAYVPSCLMIRVFMSYLRTLCLRLIIPCLSVLIFRGLTCLQSHRTSKLTYIQLMKINILIH